MHRYDIINKLIKKYDYKSYLEIGTQFGQCFQHIDIENKICVDPVKSYDKLTHEMTSDDFFQQNKEKFDIIFVDGLHTEEQCLKDILNSVKVLNKNGSIIVHDCLPSDEKFTDPGWNGTVYRSIIELRYWYSDVDVKVIDTDCGCGFIRKGKQDPYNKVPISLAKTFEYYNNNKKDLMNMISVNEFLKCIA